MRLPIYSAPAASTTPSGIDVLNSTHGSAPVDGWRSPARLAVVMVALLITIAAFSNGIPGQFVYDDDIQIVQNQYIQEARYYWTGLIG